jgi:LacI family transcriptional regulator
MAAGIRDVAARAGVGVGTVSRVINGNPGVSDATRIRVRRAIEALGYRPNLRARALSTGRTQTIGAIVPFFTHPSAVERLRGVVAGLEPSSYDIVLFNVGTTEQRARHLEAFGAAERVDGLLLVSLRPTDDEVAHFAAAGVPLVLVDAEHPALARVVSDDVEGGRLATEHLIALGHERIAFLGDLPDPAGRFVASDRRRLGWEEALRGAGLLPHPALVALGSHDRAAARAATRRLLGLARPPTAIFAASDTQALGVLEAAGAQGAEVPGDLSVIGFDDLEFATHVGLSTVRQPLFESGVAGAQLLLRALDGDGEGAEERPMGLEVVGRRSTARPGRP